MVLKRLKLSDFIEKIKLYIYKTMLLYYLKGKKKKKKKAEIKNPTQGKDKERKPNTFIKVCCT